MDHADFRDAIALLHRHAQLVSSASTSPDLIVVALSRPGEIDGRDVEHLRRAMPLAGIVTLVGTWCEGETRTGRPWPGVERLYWYEFPAWWRRQMTLRAEGRCPDWSRPGDSRLRAADCGRLIRNETAGLILVRTARAETADVLADALVRAGYAVAWERPGLSHVFIRGTTGAIWDGGQLNGSETPDLSRFCQRLASDSAPVVALLDFPRRDAAERALEIGASAVVGKPWLNSDLIATLKIVLAENALGRAA